METLDKKDAQLVKDFAALISADTDKAKEFRRFLEGFCTAFRFLPGGIDSFSMLERLVFFNLEGMAQGSPAYHGAFYFIGKRFSCEEIKRLLKVRLYVIDALDQIL
jgi:hypothetical protein